MFTELRISIHNMDSLRIGFTTPPWKQHSCKLPGHSRSKELSLDQCPTKILFCNSDWSVEFSNSDWPAKFIRAICLIIHALLGVQASFQNQVKTHLGPIFLHLNVYLAEGCWYMSSLPQALKWKLAIQWKRCGKALLTIWLFYRVYSQTWHSHVRGSRFHQSYSGHYRESVKLSSWKAMGHCTVS